jgi:hypothetical protein
MANASRFRLNQPHVVYESFADEMVLINLASGNYYSADRTGMTVIQLLVKHGSPGEIALALAARHAKPFADIEPPVRAFIAALQAEGLIVPAPAGDTPIALGSVPPELPGGTGGDFVPPHLQRFSDMQDLLLLDPIHQVDESGWPVAKTDSPKLDE